MKRKIILEFTEQELNIMFLALQKQPFEMVVELINALAAQVRAQQQNAVQPENKVEEVNKTE